MKTVEKQSLNDLVIGVVTRDFALPLSYTRIRAKPARLDQRVAYMT
jgi:hypothetical protein